MPELIRTAIGLAHELHDGQRWMNTNLPYIVHPSDVFVQLLRWGVEDDIMLSAAMLHAVTPYTISLAVGPKVAALVEELTSGKRIESAEALIIKLADHYCTVKDFLLSDPHYAKIYLQKADPLLDALHVGNEIRLAISDSFCRLEQEVRRVCASVTP